MTYIFTKPLDLKRSPIDNASADLLVLPIDKLLFEDFLNGGDFNSSGLLHSDDCDLIEKVAKSRNFSAKCGDVCMISGLQKSKFISILLYGLGDSSKCSSACQEKFSANFQESGAKISDIISSSKIQSVAIFCNSITSYDSKKLNTSAISISLGIVQKIYRFSKYLTDDKKIDSLPKLNNIKIISNDSSIDEILAHCNSLLESIYITKDLVNEPANILYPEKYAKIIKEEMNEFDNVDVDILDLKDIQKLGMGALLGVAIGSDKEPRVVTIEYKGNPDSNEYDLALVGKGLTFDSGGMSIKPDSAMEEMKDDMAGSAVVFASLRLLAKRKAKVNVVGVVGITENMINGLAQKPGDIVKSMSGKTIEVLNTDAEGRLVLADVLYYTKTKFSPKKIIDFATLTGAVVVALGFEYAGLFSNDDQLAKDIEESSLKTGEKCWRLPLDKAFDKLMDSDIADVKNISGTRGAGSITAAEFLKRFIDEHESWAHVDIAGVGGLFKSGNTFTKNGASGFGIKLVDKLIREKIEKK